jgi:hypothetical protein
MSDNHPRIIKNSLSRKCTRCTGVHDFITRLSDDASCDTPVGFSKDMAQEIATQLACGNEDVLRVPDDTIIVLDDSARQLTSESSSTTQLAQFNNTDILM